MSGLQLLRRLTWLGLFCGGLLATATVVHAEVQQSYTVGTQSSAVIAIEQALAKDVTLEFIQTPLSDVVEFLKGQANIPIILDNRSLEEAAIATDSCITANLKGVSLRSALRLLLRNLELTAIIRDEVLFITTKQTADTLLEIRVYPVSDLVDLAETDADDYAKELIGATVAVVMPTSWQEVGGVGSIKPLRSSESLVVSQTQAAHENINDFLTTLRKVRADREGK